MWMSAIAEALKEKPDTKDNDIATFDVANAIRNAITIPVTFRHKPFWTAGYFAL